MIYIVTENKKKFLSGKKWLNPFNIKVSQKELDIIEPQSEDIQSITKSKATQAFTILHKPVLVTDAGVSIPALKGFPGPFMHYITKWLTVEDLLNLTKDKKDRSIIFENVIAYKDRKHVKVFSAKREGVLLKTPKGEGIPLDQILTFRDDLKTVAQCDVLGESRFGKELTDSIWTQFGTWYKASIP